MQTAIARCLPSVAGFTLASVNCVQAIHAISQATLLVKRATRLKTARRYAGLTQHELSRR